MRPVVLFAKYFRYPVLYPRQIAILLLRPILLGLIFNKKTHTLTIHKIQTLETKDLTRSHQVCRVKLHMFFRRKENFILITSVFSIYQHMKKDIKDRLSAFTLFKHPTNLVKVNLRLQSQRQLPILKRMLQKCNREKTVAVVLAARDHRYRIGALVWKDLRYRLESTQQKQWEVQEQKRNFLYQLIWQKVCNSFYRTLLCNFCESL